MSRSHLFNYNFTTVIKYLTVPLTIVCWELWFGFPIDKGTIILFHIPALVAVLILVLSRLNNLFIQVFLALGIIYICHFLGLFFFDGLPAISPQSTSVQIDWWGGVRNTGVYALFYTGTTFFFIVTSIVIAAVYHFWRHYRNFS